MPPLKTHLYYYSYLIFTNDNNGQKQASCAPNQFKNGNILAPPFTFPSILFLFLIRTKCHKYLVFWCLKLSKNELWLCHMPFHVCNVHLHAESTFVVYSNFCLVCGIFSMPSQKLVSTFQENFCSLRIEWMTDRQNVGMVLNCFKSWKHQKQKNVLLKYYY